MKSRLAVCLLCAFCASGARSLALDRNAFTFTNYNLDAHIEPDQQRLGVRGTITLRNDSAIAQKYAILQISSSLDWRSIQINGEPVPFVSHPYTSDIDHTGALSEAIVTLPREVAPKATLEFSIGYEGVLSLDTTRVQRVGMPKDLASHIDWDRIGTDFSGVRGVGHVVWFPVSTDAANFSEGTAFSETVMEWKARQRDSLMQLQIRVPHGGGVKVEPTILVNSLLCTAVASDLTRQESSTLCSFNPIGVLEPPAFFIANWKIQTSENATLFTLPGHDAAASAYIQAANRTAPFVRDWFGRPSRPVQLVDAGPIVTAPFEAGPLLVVPFSPSDDAQGVELNLVHALTHSTFSSSRPWIYEGLAHFAQALWREQEAARQAALDFMGLHRPALVDAETDAVETSRSSAAHSLILTADENYYRTKAMFVWWMLRDMLGESALKKALVAYQARDDKEASYVQHLLEKQSGRDLEWFFDDWIYRDRGLPDFRVQSAYSRPLLGSGYLVTVTIEDLGDAGAEVPVKILVEGGEVTKRMEVRAKSKASIRIELPSKPHEVIVNDGSVPESDLTNNIFKIAASEQNQGMANPPWTSSDSRGRGISH